MEVEQQQLINLSFAITIKPTNKGEGQGTSRPRQTIIFFYLSSVIFCLLAVVEPPVGPKRLLLKYLKHNAVDSKQAFRVRFGSGWTRVRRKVKWSKDGMDNWKGELCRKVANASIVLLFGIILRIRPECQWEYSDKLRKGWTVTRFDRSAGVKRSVVI